jgi:hypothetical protein
MILLRYYLWIAPHLICGAAAIVAYRKKLHEAYPAFLSLLVFELWIVWAVALLGPSQHLYKWFLVIDVVAGFLLEILVLHELVSVLSTSRKSLARLLHPLPRWTAAILILLAVLATASLPQTAREEVMLVVQNLNLALNIIAAGLLLAMLVFARILGVHLRSLALGIALGIGITAAAEIATSPVMSLLGKSSYITLDLVRLTAFTFPQ